MRLLLGGGRSHQIGDIGRCAEFNISENGCHFHALLHADGLVLPVVFAAITHREEFVVQGQAVGDAGTTNALWTPI